MARFWLSRLLRERFWGVVLAALIVGWLTGDFAGRREDEVAVFWLGKAWSGTPAEARGVLGGIFGLQFTVLTIVLSMTSPLVQSAANQYSPRLVPFFMRAAPVRRAIPMFLLSAAYLLAAERALGFLADVERPRVVVSGAFVLLLAAFGLLVGDMMRTYRYMRVERVLGLVGSYTRAALQRLSKRTKGLVRDRDPQRQVPANARPLTACSSGYVVDVDARRLARVARRAGVRMRLCRVVGTHVDAGEAIGWVSASDGGEIAPRVAERLAKSVTIGPTREPDYDPGYGVRILAEVAARSLSSSYNDSYTALQALQQMRALLRHMARSPQGDWAVVERDDTVRVSVMGLELRELVSLGLDMPLRHGARYVDVLEGVLEIAVEVGLAAVEPEGRRAALELVNRVLDHALRYGDLDPTRIGYVRAQAELARASILNHAPRLYATVRADWVLTNGGLAEDLRASGAPDAGAPGAGAPDAGAPHAATARFDA